jgi:hypothetical protein
MPVKTVLDNFAAGHRAVMVSGRSLWDVHLDDLGQIRPLRQTLIRQARQQHSMAALSFNLAQGAVWDTTGLTTQQRTEMERALREAGVDVAALAGREAAGRLPHERALALLNAIYIAATTRENLPPLLLLIDFTEHLAPSASGQATDFTLQLTEMLWMLAHEFRLRAHALFMVFTGCRELIDSRVAAALPEVRLPQPSRDDKLPFIGALRDSELRRAATLETGLDDNAIAALNSHTPNRGLEQLFFGSARTGLPITRSQLVDRKRDDIVALSDGTLRLLDTDRVALAKLIGRTMQPVIELLTRWAESLRTGNPLMPMNVLLAGAPSTGKTDVALLLARMAGVPALEMASPKGSFVGETERRSKLQWRVFKELSPAMGFVDEVTETWGLRRGGMNLDSGATDAMQGAMLEALSDTSRAGKTLIVATTNCPWRLGAAQETRWTTVPVLSAVPEDFPDIICAIASTLGIDLIFDKADPLIIEAAHLLAEKGTPPRTIRSALSIEASLRDGPLTPQRVLYAATQVLPLSRRALLSAEYADLAAIAQCTTAEFLPWAAAPTAFPFPSYLKAIVDPATGCVNRAALEARMAELSEVIDV